MFIPKSGTLIDEKQWREYSICIEAYGKIWGFCVDNLHDEVLKILGGVCRSYDSDKKNEEITQVIPMRKILKAEKTLEENESAINLKDFEKYLKSDLHFKAMNCRFDSSSAKTMLLNAYGINSELDIILNSDDIIFSEVLHPGQAEVNLEGIVTFSANELIYLDFCDISKFEEVVSPNISESINFDNIKKLIDQAIEPPLQENDYLSSENENIEINDQDERIEYNNNQPFEERINTNNDFKFLETSNKVWFSQDSLVKDITNKKNNKRKRPKNFEEDKATDNFCILKIEIDEKKLFAPKAGQCLFLLKFYIFDLSFSTLFVSSFCIDMCHSSCWML